MHSSPTLYFIVGLLFVVLGVPLVQRRIPRNQWYGFRVAKTLANDRVWYEANVVLGRDLVAAGVAIAFSALVTMAIARLTEEWVLALINLVVFMGAAIVAILHSFSMLRKM